VKIYKITANWDDNTSIICSKPGILVENRVKVKCQGQGHLNLTQGHLTLTQGHVTLRYALTIVRPYRGKGSIVILYSGIIGENTVLRQGWTIMHR